MTDNNKKLLTLALAGLATGAAVWFLLSTDKGKKARDFVMDSIKDHWGERIDEFSGQAAETVKGLKNRARGSVKMPA